MTEGYKILVVEDDADVRDSLKDALDREKIYSPVLVENGEMGLEYALDTEFDAYLVDQNMPDMRGTKFIKHLSVIHPNSLTYIISAYVIEGGLDEAKNYEVETGKKLPISRFIEKPWPKDTFSVALRSDLENRAEKIKLEKSDEQKDAKIKKLEKASVDLVLGFCEEVNGYLPEIEKCTESIQTFSYEPDLELADYIYFLSGKDINEYIEQFKSLNRYVHTLKGNSSIIGFTQLNKYCHTLEELTVNIAKGDLYLNNEASDIISRISIIIGRFLEEISTTQSDENVSIDEDLKDIGECKQSLTDKMQGKQIHLSDIPKRDIGKVRAREKEVKLSVSLKTYDTLIDKYQDLSQQFFRIMREYNIEDVNVYTASVDYFNEIISASQSLIDLSRYSRMVKDMERSLHKEIEFTIIKNNASARPDVWDTCHTALVHMVRNAVDHGIEDPMVREQLGKSPRGTISLEVFEDNKNIYIVLQDDGNGIDENKVSEIALKNNIISTDELQSMNKENKQKLIFKPGFSSKESVSDISGRGVGMDVVLDSIEKKLNGYVRLESNKNEGTKIILEIPKSTTLSECVIFGDDNVIYAIHQPSKINYIRYDESMITILPDESYMYKNNGNVYPMIDVFGLLGHEHNELKTLIEIWDATQISYGLAVPKIFGHKILRIERQDRYTKKLKQENNAIDIFGYSLFNNIPLIVLDFDKFDNICSIEEKAIN